DGDDVRLAIATAEHVLRELLASHQRLGSNHQVLEQAEFGRGHGDDGALDADDTVALIELYGPVLQLGTQLTWATAAAQRPNARDQFVEHERFREVVVAAGVEAADAIGWSAAAGEQQDRRIGAPAAKATADGEPVVAWQHHIEHDDIVDGSLQAVFGGGAVAH